MRNKFLCIALWVPIYTQVPVLLSLSMRRIDLSSYCWLRFLRLALCDSHSVQKQHSLLKKKQIKKIKDDHDDFWIAPMNSKYKTNMAFLLLPSLHYLMMRSLLAANPLNKNLQTTFFIPFFFSVCIYTLCILRVNRVSFLAGYHERYRVFTVKVPWPFVTIQRFFIFSIYLFFRSFID